MKSQNNKRSKLWNKNPALLLLAGERSQSPLWEVKHFVLFSASLSLFRYIYVFPFFFRLTFSLIDEPLGVAAKDLYLYPASFFGMATGKREESLFARRYAFIKAAVQYLSCKTHNCTFNPLFTASGEESKHQLWSWKLVLCWSHV